MENQEYKFVSAVVYSYNTGKYIEQFVEKIIESINSKFTDFEIIIVDDCSTDNSLDIIRSLMKKNKEYNVSLINMNYHQGVELAMKAGIDLTIGDYIYQFDKVILDFNADTIISLYDKCIEGNDIVVAESSKIKDIRALLFYKLYNFYKKGKNKIGDEVFILTSRRAINRVDSMNKTIPFRRAVYANCGLKREVVKINLNGNSFGLTLNTNKFETAIDSLVIFTDLAYKLAITISVIMVLAFIVAVIYAVVLFVNKVPVEGWTTTIIIISFGFVCISIILAIIVKYLCLLLNLIFKKQSYLIENIDKN
jgi:dolichol-phosphate mannosyltransferase